MTRTLQFVCVSCLVAFTVCAMLLLRDVDRQVNAAGPKLIADADALHDSIAKLNESLGVFHDAEQKQADFYDPQKKGGATQQIYRILKDTKKLIGRTDISLNGGTTAGGALDRLSEALYSTQGLMIAATTDLDSTTNKLQPILTDLGTASAAMAKKTPAILDSLSQSSANVVTITAKSADSIEEIRATTHDFRQMADKVREDFLRPANRIKSYFSFVLEHAYQVRALVP